MVSALQQDMSCAPQEAILSFLPLPLACEIRDICQKTRAATLCEIRLRCKRLASLTFYRDGGLCTYPLTYVADENAMREVLLGICQGSVYAYEGSVKQGYISLPGGCRVGLCGEAIAQGEEIKSIRRVTSLVFRLPHSLPSCAASLVARFRARRESVLVFSPPGGGKTTLLKAAVQALSGGRDGLRVAVVDSRGELSDFGRDCLVDILSGYPKACGMEIAVRTLSPELVVCDEIGEGEAEALRGAAQCGVPILASAHAESVEQLYRRPVLGQMCRAGFFPILWRVGQGEMARI